jgi:hypothetical protein
MRIDTLFTCVLMPMTCVQAQSVRTYAPDAADRSSHRIPAIFEMTGTLLPHWTGQTLIGVQDNQSNGPLVYMIDREGRRDHFSFSIPDAGVIYVHGLAIGSDGTVAITGGALSGNSRGGSFLALVPPDRKSQTVVRTWPYVAMDVAFVPDGSLWTEGYTFHDTEIRIVKPNIMAHFDSTGKLLASFPVTAKARFGPGRPAALQHSFLRTSHDRMGWFTNGLEYIEYSFDGREIGRYEGPEVRDPEGDPALRASFALSNRNEVLFGTIIDAKRQTWQLDREKVQWIPVQFQDESLPAWGRLLGFDGDTLVTTGKLHEMRRHKGTSKTNAQK